MRLAELEVLQVVLFHKGLPCHIERGEQPTTTRTLLVGDGLPLSLHFTIVDVDVRLETPDQVLHYSPSYNDTNRLLRQASRGSDLVQTF